MVQYDGTVRNSIGQLIQLRYGYDGFCGEKLEFQKMPTILLSDEKFQNKFKFDISNDAQMKQLFTCNVYHEMKFNIYHVKDELENEWKQLNNDRVILRNIFPMGECNVVLPCNLRRIIWNVQKNFHINKKYPTDLSPLKVINGMIHKIIIYIYISIYISTYI